MEDLTSNWLWYGELRPLSGPGARGRGPQREQRQRKQASARRQVRRQRSEDSGRGRRLCAHAPCLQKQARPCFLASPQSQVSWVVRIHATKLHPTLSTFPSLDCSAGFTPNRRAGCGPPAWPGGGWAAGCRPGRCPFPVSRLQPLDGQARGRGLKCPLPAGALGCLPLPSPRSSPPLSLSFSAGPCQGLCRTQ